MIDDGVQKTDCHEKGIKYLGFKLLKPGTSGLYLYLRVNLYFYLYLYLLTKSELPIGRNLWATYAEMPDPAECQVGFITAIFSRMK